MASLMESGCRLKRKGSRSPKANVFLLVKQVRNVQPKAAATFWGHPKTSHFMDMVVSSSGVFAVPITSKAPIVVSMLPWSSDTLLEQTPQANGQNAACAGKGIRFACVEVDNSSAGRVKLHVDSTRREFQHCNQEHWSVEYSHIRSAGHVLLHLCELFDVFDRSMKSTINSLEAPDGAL